MAPNPIVVASICMTSQSVGEASVRMTYLRKEANGGAPETPGEYTSVVQW